MISEKSLIKILDEYVKPYIATDEDLVRLHKAEREIKKLKIYLETEQNQIKSLNAAYSSLLSRHTELLSQQMKTPSVDRE